MRAVPLAAIRRGHAYAFGRTREEPAPWSARGAAGAVRPQRSWSSAALVVVHQARPGERGTHLLVRVRRPVGVTRGGPDKVPTMNRAARVTTRNARFQQWEALLTNRTKRRSAGEFLVHGVRPITSPSGMAGRSTPSCTPPAAGCPRGRRLLRETRAEQVEMARRTARRARRQGRRRARGGGGAPARRPHPHRRPAGPSSSSTGRPTRQHRHRRTLRRRLRRRWRHRDRPRRRRL